MSKNGTGKTAPVPWQRLREWLENQEALDTQLDGQSSLTKEQLLAISQLVPFLDDEEPSVGDKNYLGPLHEWAQARGHPLPAFTEETPLLVPVAGVLQPRFQYSCRLSWWNVTLPREGYGLDAGKTAPFFQSKKLAKQYTAKQALDYIQAQKKPQVPAQWSPS
ncbi:hypothetical protein S40285_00279, partial [Stachybotrys chlorohalonatus IBT 40285]